MTRRFFSMAFSEGDRVQRVLCWREALSRLPDSHFFELMRMYLGEVKTPYNKQKLIESLGAFLHKPEIRERIAGLLSLEDVQVLSAIVCLEHPTQQMLARFFSGKFTFGRLYDLLMNLEERLLVFQYEDKAIGYRIFAVNPLLEDLLEPFLSVSLLLPPASFVPGKAQCSRKISDLLLAAVVSFVAASPDICKQNGLLKKKTMENLVEKFPGFEAEQDVEFFQTLVEAAANLSLFQVSSRGFVPDYQRWNQFARLRSDSQVSFLAAAACGRDSKTRLQRKARQVLQLIGSVPQEGFAVSTLERAEFLAFHGKSCGNTEPRRHGSGIDSDSASTNVAAGKSRLAQIMEAGRVSQSRSSGDGDDDVFECVNESVAETKPDDAVLRGESLSLVQASIQLGLLSKVAELPSGKDGKDGKDGNTEPVYVAVPLDSPFSDGSEPKGLMSVDAGFTVTVLPGLPLSQLLPLVQCMNLVRFDTVATFEITRASCRRAFDHGQNPSSIIDRLQRYTAFPLPQNLRVSLEDWFQAYQSADLYRGYVLHVKDGRDVSANPVLARHIVKVLEKGVYLMDFLDDEEALRMVSGNGFENIGSVRGREEGVSVSFFPDVSLPCIEPVPNLPCNLPDESAVCGLLSDMEVELERRALPAHQEEGLRVRIRRKIILSAQQLRGDSVRSEVLEASGMDIQGKVRVAEQALATGTMLELVFGTDLRCPSVVLGFPISLDKKSADVSVTLRLEPEQDIGVYSISQAASVRRLRGAIFKEIPAT